MNRSLRFACLVIMFAGAILLGTAQMSSSQTTAQPVPVMDGGAGPCSCELTIFMPDGKPAPAADVKVHIAYGFGGFHRLDLEAGTNVDGKVRFTGLPSKVKNPPLEFRAAKDQLEGVATFDPLTECRAKHDITLATAGGR